MKSKRNIVILGIVLIVCLIAVLKFTLFSNADKETGGIMEQEALSPEAASTSQVPSTPEAAFAQEAASAQEQSPAASSAAPGTIAIKLGIWPDSKQTDEIGLYESYSAKMRELHPNVIVEPASYKFNMNDFYTMAQAGALPTIFEAQIWNYDKNLFFENLADISGELATRGWDKAMNPSLKDCLSISGNIYGLPRDGYALGLMMNADLFRKAGLVDTKGYPLYPKTTDELAVIAGKIKAATGKAGICILAKDYAGCWQYEQIAMNFGATLCIPNGDGTYKANLDSKDAIAAMNYIKDLKWKYDVLTADPSNEDWNTGFAALGKGEAAMYIGANDAVNQPTQVNGLAPDKLAMCAFPMGPKGDAYCLMGSNGYYFSKAATPDEINACLDYLEIMGKSPVVSEGLTAGMRKDAQNNAANGIPVIPKFPCWMSKEYIDTENAVINEFANVDSRMFEPYVNAIMGPAYKLRFEAPGSSSDLYMALFDVLHAIIADKNSDVTALMKAANAKYQQALDVSFPRR